MYEASFERTIYFTLGENSKYCQQHETRTKIDRKLFAECLKAFRGVPEKKGKKNCLLTVLLNLSQFQSCFVARKLHCLKETGVRLKVCE